jgi:hypothetical protein
LGQKAELAAMPTAAMRVRDPQVAFCASDAVEIECPAGHLTRRTRSTLMPTQTLGGATSLRAIAAELNVRGADEAVRRWDVTYSTGSTAGPAASVSPLMRDRPSLTPQG